MKGICSRLGKNDFMVRFALNNGSGFQKIRVMICEHCTRFGTKQSCLKSEGDLSGQIADCIINILIYSVLKLVKFNISR